MKKFLILLTAIAILFTSGCMKKTDEPIADITPSPAPDWDPYYTLMQSDTRPIAVMIDNDDDNARPQQGLEDAYLVYEIVVEGSATRYMALFKNHDIEKVGPVRSSRHYFLDYVMENDAIYAHCGWSPKAANDISSLDINNINGILGDDGVNFWRDNTYNSTWHNLYTSTKKLSEYASSSKGYATTTDKNLLEYNTKDTDLPESAQVNSKLTIPYSSAYTVSFEYDAESKTYKRFYNGKEYKSQSGATLTAKNIIVYEIENFNLNDGENKGRQDLKNIGEGEGYYLSNGKAAKIKWSKESRESKTIYTYEDGTEITLNPGNTFIQIVPAAKGYTVE